MKKPDIPEIELIVKPESPQILVGESCTISWKVGRAQKVYVLPGPAGVLGGLPVDWRQLDQKGEEAKQEGQITVSPQVTTTYTIAAIGPGGRQARSVTIEVLKEKPLRGEPKTWYTDWDPLSPDWRRRLDEAVHRWASCYGRDAEVIFSVNHRARFVDEETTLTWEITCSNCAEMRDGGNHVILIEDLDSRSGTRDVAGVAWARNPPACSLDMSGEEDVGATRGAGRYTWTIHADAVWGSAASATVQVGFIPRPVFDGCNAERQSAIAEALKDIYQRLLDGCIRDDADLDDAMQPFREGWMDRVDFWGRLVAQLENLNLITFRCSDTADEEWRGSHWEEYGNIIDLEWSPNHSPSLAYLILHELIHKCGFNGDLEDRYLPGMIDAQAWRLTGACDLYKRVRRGLRSGHLQSQ